MSSVEFVDTDERYRGCCCFSFLHIKRVIILLSVIELIFGVAICCIIGYALFCIVDHSNKFVVAGLLISVLSIFSSVTSGVGLFTTRPALLLFTLALRSFTTFFSFGLACVFIARSVQYDTVEFTKQIFPSKTATISIRTFSQLNIPIIHVLIGLLMTHGFFGVFVAPNAITSYVYLYDKETARRSISES